MTFDRNQRAFPSTPHQSIWHAAVFLAPFSEVIPPTLPDAEAARLREGEKSLDCFITELYAESAVRQSGSAAL